MLQNYTERDKHGRPDFDQGIRVGKYGKATKFRSGNVQERGEKARLLPAKVRHSRRPLMCLELGEGEQGPQNQVEEEHRGCCTRLKTGNSFYSKGKSLKTSK